MLNLPKVSFAHVLFRSRAPNWLRNRPIAHRGLHDERALENTMPAFEAAIDAGYPIELDLHLTRDGSLAVFHDENLDRLSDARGPISARTRAELSSLSLGDTHLRIPWLDEVLELVGGRVPLVLEVKNRGPVGPLEARLVRHLDAYRGEYTIQAFNPQVLRWFREQRPRAPRGLLATNFQSLDLRPLEKFVLRRLLLAPAVAPDYIGYDIRCLPYWAPSLTRRLGLPLVAWTIRSAQDQQRALDLADNIIFEEIRPDPEPR